MKSIKVCLAVVLGLSFLLNSNGCSKAAAPTDPNTKGNSSLTTLFSFITSIPNGVAIEGVFQSSFTKWQNVLDNDVNTTHTAVFFAGVEGWLSGASISLNGISLTDVENRVSVSPTIDHIWRVDSNQSLGLPFILDTIPAIPAFEITSPSDGSALSRPFTITWSDPIGSDSVLVDITPIYEKDTSFSTTVNSLEDAGLFLTPDNGSITLTNNMLSQIPSGKVIISVTRYSFAIHSFGGKDYLFVRTRKISSLCTIN